MMEVQTDETCINIDNITTSSIPSEDSATSNIPTQNEMISNGPHRTPKSTTFSQDAISISESVIEQKPVKKEKANSKQANKHITLSLEKSYLPAILLTLMCVVVVILQIPTIVFYTDPPSAEASLLFEKINLETCSVDNLEFHQDLVITPLIMICNNSGLCSNYNETEYHELEILRPVYSLSVVLENGQCGEAVLQFFYNAINATNNNNYTLIRDCLKIRDDICAAEWRIAEIFFNASLPDCNSFDEDANFITGRAPTLSCPDDFGVFCGSLCQPLCDEISIFNDTVTVVYEILNIILHTLSLIGGVVTFIVCCVHRKKMFRFPMVFVVYSTITFEIISIFLLLPYVFGSDNLLCSHPNLIVSATKPTAFCQIQGLVIQTGALVFFGFWLFHLSHLLYSLKYPFKAQKLMKSPQLKRNHIIEVVVTLVCGLVPSLVIISTSGYQHFAFPPTCNNGIPEVLFYTFIFPMSIGATVGLCMLLMSFVILRKHHHSKTVNLKVLMKRPSLREIMFTSYSIPETKLIILFSYYGITVLLLLTHLVMILRSNDTVVENISNFTTCSAGGYRTECDVYRENLNNNLTPTIVFDLISTLFLSFVNIVNLFYVLQYRDIKEAFKKAFSSTSSTGS